MKKNNTKISFVMPAYNCAEIIEETIDSIYNGNFEEGDEVIVVNDASTDNTAEILQKLSKKYPQLIVLKHNINKKTAAAARNTAIDSSKNELIFAIDSDNVLVPDSVSKLRDYMEKENAEAAVFGEIWFFRDTIKNITQKWIFNKEIKAQDPLSTHTTPCPTGNYLFTKESWIRAGRYFEPTIINQTLDSWTFGVRQLFTGTKMVCLPGTYYLHRTGINSHWIRENKNGNVSLAALVAIIPFLDKIGDEDVDYIFSKEGRLAWFDNLQERPVKIKNEEVVQHMNRVIKIHKNVTVLARIKNLLKKFLK
jgi:glycosyltransferase involved in cell wall biosynthesis